MHFKENCKKLICKEFVEMHGGTIQFESETDKGSEFKFTLPHYI
jgi:signal transduction histidine kinase